MKKLAPIILALGWTAGSLFGNPLNVEEISKVKKSATELTLEQKVSWQGINIFLNYEAENKENAADYGKSDYSYPCVGEAFSNNAGSSYKEAFPEFTISEREEIDDIITNIKNGGINSYADFIGNSKPLSGNQKLALLAMVSDLLYRGAYDNSLLSREVSSQDVFFADLQNFLNTGEQQSIGECGQISTHIEKLARDLGLTAATVDGNNGGGHSYDLIKIEDGRAAIIDGSQIIIADTKNIEKLIETYQRNNHSIIFYHEFFEDSKFKYNLLTENGKNFLKFVGYDESVNTLKETLISGNSNSLDRKIIFNKTGSELSVEADFSGIFAKSGIFMEIPLCQWNIYYSRQDTKKIFMSLIFCI